MVNEKCYDKPKELQAKARVKILIKGVPVAF